MEKEGVLLDVSTDYILILEPGTGNTVACDAQNIKFILIYYIQP